MYYDNIYYNEDYAVNIIENWLDNVVTNDKLLQLYQDYGDYLEDSIYPIDADILNDVLEHQLTKVENSNHVVVDAFTKGLNSDFSWNDDYFIIDGYWNLESFPGSKLGEYMDLSNLAQIIFDEELYKKVGDEILENQLENALITEEI